MAKYEDTLMDRVGYNQSGTLNFDQYNADDEMTKMKKEVDPASNTSYGDSSKAALNSMQQGGSTVDALAAAGAASGDPYMMAAGLGLGVLSAGEKRKRQEEMNAYNDALMKNQARRDAINQVVNVYQGQKGLF